MRTYAINPKRNKISFQTRRDRKAVEWDLTLPIVDVQDVPYIKRRVQPFIDRGVFKYVLIGGVEVGDTEDPDKTTFMQPHVHVAIILKEEAIRSKVIWYFTEMKLGKIYCTPRTGRYPYFTWRLHHCKVETKEDPEKCIILEHGKLPKDADKSVDRGFIERFIRKYSYTKDDEPAGFEELLLRITKDE